MPEAADSIKSDLDFLVVHACNRDESHPFPLKRAPACDSVHFLNILSPDRPAATSGCHARRPRTAPEERVSAALRRAAPAATVPPGPPRVHQRGLQQSGITHRPGHKPAAHRPSYTRPTGTSPGMNNAMPGSTTFMREPRKGKKNKVDGSSRVAESTGRHRIATKFRIGCSA